MSRAKHWVGNSNNKNKLYIFCRFSSNSRQIVCMITNYGSVLNDVMSEE